MKETQSELFNMEGEKSAKKQRMTNQSSSTIWRFSKNFGGGEFGDKGRLSFFEN